MWSAPAKNMKKINMSISFVYDVSIQDNCEKRACRLCCFALIPLQLLLRYKGIEADLSCCFV